MSDLPGFVISFDSPPPSPTIAVAFSDESKTHNPTPKRKARQVNTAPKRIRKNTIPSAASSSSNQIPTNSEGLSLLSINTSPDWEYDLQTAQEYNTGAYPDTYAQYGDTMSLAQNNNCVDQGYAQFVESVMGEECAFWQISRTLFVTNGWDAKTCTTTPYWYHIQQVPTGTGKSIACLCPESSKHWVECFHIRFLKDFGDERFPPDMHLSGE